MKSPIEKDGVGARANIPTPPVTRRKSPVLKLLKQT